MYIHTRCDQKINVIFNFFNLFIFSIFYLFINNYLQGVTFSHLRKIETGAVSSFQNCFMATYASVFFNPRNTSETHFDIAACFDFEYYIFRVYIYMCVFLRFYPFKNLKNMSS